MITSAGEDSTARHSRINTSIVGVFFPDSSMLTYSRETLARAATSSWVSPAFSLSLRSSSENTSPTLRLDRQPSMNYAYGKHTYSIICQEECAVFLVHAHVEQPVWTHCRLSFAGPHWVGWHRSAGANRRTVAPIRELRRGESRCSRLRHPRGKHNRNDRELLPVACNRSLASLDGREGAALGRQSAGGASRRVQLLGRKPLPLVPVFDQYVRCRLVRVLDQSLEGHVNPPRYWH